MAPRAPRPPAQKPKPARSRGVAKSSKAQSSKSSIADNPALKAVLAIAEKNRTDSPLLRLPGEIRSLIYKHVFADHHIEVWLDWSNFTMVVNKEPDHFPCKDRFSRSWFSRSWSQLLSLTFACRQLHKETRSLPCNMNVIRFRNSLDFYLCVEIAPKELLARITNIQFDEADYDKYRRGLSRLRALPDPKNVFVKSVYGDKILREGEFVERACKQEAKWQLFLAQESDDEEDDESGYYLNINELEF